MDKYIVGIEAREVIHTGKYSEKIVWFEEIFTDYNCALNFVKEEMYYERDGIHYLIESMSDPIRIKDVQSNQDTIYVIYLDGVMYTENNRKCAYLNPSGAKAVITSDSRKVAHNMYQEAKIKDCWYDIGEEGKQQWIDKARERFEIREFVERR